MKTKLFRILGVFATLATLLTLVGAAPLAADTANPQKWVELTSPNSAASAANLILTNGAGSPGSTQLITTKGPMAQAKDASALWVAVAIDTTSPASDGVADVWKIIKSTDGGRTWPTQVTIGTSAAAAAVALAASPTEANVLYYATTTTVYKSVDGGATFTAEANIPSGSIAFLQVAQFSGRYIIVVATTGTAANVYYFDESTPFFGFTTVGTNSFAAAVVAMGGTTVTNMLALALGPNFGTDRTVAAIGTDGVSTYVMVDVYGGAWGATIGNPTVGAVPGQIPVGVSTSAAIGFPSDFTVATSPNFFFALGGATANKGIYRFIGVNTPSPNPAPSIVTLLTGGTVLGSGSSALNQNFVSMDVAGAFASASIVAGNAAGGLARSSDAGATFSTRQLDTAGSANKVYVMYKKGATTPIYILVGGTATVKNDDTAFYTSTGTSNYHALSLINNTMGVKAVDIAANGEIFAGTTSNTILTTNDSFTINAGGIGSGDAFSITPNAAGGFDAFSVTATGVGVFNVQVPFNQSAPIGAVSCVISGGAPVITTVVAGQLFQVSTSTAGDQVTVTATVAPTIAQWSLVSGTVPTAAKVFDPNNSFTILGSGAPMTLDANLAVVEITDATSGAFTVTGLVGATWASPYLTFTSATGIAIVTATAVGNITTETEDTLTGGTGSSTATIIQVETNDPNGSQTVPAAEGTTSGTDMNATEVVTLASTVAVTISSSPSTGIFTGTSPVTSSTITFTANGQFVTVTYASGTPTVTVTGPTGAIPVPSVIAIGGTASTTGLSIVEVADVDLSQVPAWAPATFTMNAYTTFVDYLWRFFPGATAFPGTTGNWERVFKASGSTLDFVKVDPAYPTSNAVFTLDSTVDGLNGAYVQKSTNNGDSFSAQSILPGNGTTYANTTATAFAVVNANTVYIATTGGNVTSSTTNGFIWSSSVISDSTLAPIGTITQLVVAANGDILAVGTNGTNVRVAKALAATPTVWGTASNPVNDTTMTGFTSANVQPAADYATSGIVYVSASYTSNGLVRWGTVSSATTNVWTDVDANVDWASINGFTPLPNTVVGTSTSNSVLLTAPGGPGFTAEGTGMAYMVGTNVGRVKGRVPVTSYSATEVIPAPVVSGSSVPMYGLFSNAALNSVGSVNFLSLSLNPSSQGYRFYTYTDTLNKAETGVAVSNIITDNACLDCGTAIAKATIKWDAVPNANYYFAIIDDVAQFTNVYDALDVAEATTLAARAAFITTGTTWNVTGLPAGDTLYVSVWAVKYMNPATTDSLAGFSSLAAVAEAIEANSLTSFGMGATFNTPSAAPAGLAPAPAATGITINPAFQWNAVAGATSYKFQLADNSAFTSPMVDTSVTGTSYAYTGTALKYGTAYFWRVAAVGPTGQSSWVTNTFSTVAAPPGTAPIIITAPTQAPPVISITVPIPTIVVPQITLPPISINLPTPTITLPPGTTTTVQPQIILPKTETPVYIWIIVAVGAILTVAVIVLIIRTRRVV